MRRLTEFTDRAKMLPFAVLSSQGTINKAKYSTQKRSISGCSGTSPYRNGFSLIEVLVVIAIIGILLAIASPLYQKWISDYQIHEEANLIYSQLGQARAEAIQKNMPVVCLLTAGTGNAAEIRIFVDSTVPANFAFDTGEQVLFDQGLQSGQVLSNVDFSPTANAFGFDARGMSLNGRTGSFKISDGGQTYTISINLVGLISMQS